MPKYRYEGKVPMRVANNFVEYGMEVELPTAPNRLFVEVKEVKFAKPVKVILPDKGEDK